MTKITVKNPKQKRSSVLGKTPTQAQLEYGELAINYNVNNPFLVFKDSANRLRKINTDVVSETPESIKYKYESNENTNAYTDIEKSKLDGIEDGAQVNTINDVSIGTLDRVGNGLGVIKTTFQNKALFRYKSGNSVNIYELDNDNNITPWFVNDRIVGHMLATTDMLYFIDDIGLQQINSSKVKTTLFTWASATPSITNAPNIIIGTTDNDQYLYLAYYFHGMDLGEGDYEYPYINIYKFTIATNELVLLFNTNEIYSPLFYKVSDTLIYMAEGYEVGFGSGHLLYSITNTTVTLVQSIGEVVGMRKLPDGMVYFAMGDGNGSYDASYVQPLSGTNRLLAYAEGFRRFLKYDGTDEVFFYVEGYEGWVVTPDMTGTYRITANTIEKITSQEIYEIVKSGNRVFGRGTGIVTIWDNQYKKLDTLNAGDINRDFSSLVIQNGNPYVVTLYAVYQVFESDQTYIRKFGEWVEFDPTTKADAEVGKGLSSNDYTDEEKTKLASLSNYDDTNLKNAVDNKVDKIPGMGLSSNDYTTVDKEKLESLSNYDDTAIRSQINNKVDKVDGLGLSENSFTTTEKEKLANLESSKFLGAFDNEADLLLSYPANGTGGKWTTFTGDKTGCTADVSVNNVVHQYAYNGTDTWTDMGATGSDSAEMIKEKYESNPDTNAFTDAEKTKLSGLENYDDTVITQSLSNKVDKVVGKALSTNDYTTEEKTKLSRIGQYATGEFSDGAPNATMYGFRYNFTNPNTGLGGSGQYNITGASQTAAGVMSATDKVKLDGIDGNKDVMYKEDWGDNAGNPITNITPTVIRGDLQLEIEKWDPLLTEEHIYYEYETLPSATQSASGVMSSADKIKLDGLSNYDDTNVVKYNAENNIQLREKTKILGSNENQVVHELIGLGEYATDYIPLSAIVVGNNLKGRTVKFDTTKIPVRLAEGNQAFVISATQVWLFHVEVYPTAVILYCNGIPVYNSDTGGWIVTDYTFPNEDIIVNSFPAITKIDVNAGFNPFNDIQISDGNLYDQVEVSCTLVHLNLNTNTDPTYGNNVTVSTPVGKKVLVYKEDVDALMVRVQTLEDTIGTLNQRLENRLNGVK